MMNAKEHLAALTKDEVAIEDLLEAYITEAGIIGVGLITLEEELLRVIRDLFRNRK